MAGKFLTNGSWSDEPFGYIYQADFYCPTHLIENLISRGKAAPAARDMVSGDVLEQISHAEGVDFSDEYSYDSDDFPKVVTDDREDLDGYGCTECANEEAGL